MKSDSPLDSWGNLGTVIILNLSILAKIRVKKPNLFTCKVINH